MECVKKTMDLGSVAAVWSFPGRAGWEDRFSRKFVSLCGRMTCFDGMCAGTLSAQLAPQNSTAKLPGQAQERRLGFREKPAELSKAQLGPEEGCFGMGRESHGAKAAWHWER